MDAIGDSTDTRAAELEKKRKTQLYWLTQEIEEKASVIMRDHGIKDPMEVPWNAPKVVCDTQDALIYLRAIKRALEGGLTMQAALYGIKCGAAMAKARIGMKHIESGRRAQSDKIEARQRLYAQFQEAVDQLRRKHPFWSRHRICSMAGDQFGVTAKTIKNHTDPW